MSHATERLAAIRDAVSGLAGADLAGAGRRLLDVMGYRSPKTLDTPAAPAQFLAALGMDAARFETSRWRAVHFLFQLTGDELPALSRGGDPATGEAFQRGAIDSFVFLAIDLDDGGWSRRQLVAIVRALNRGFAMPVIVLFRHGGQATLTVIDRRANRRDAARDVVGGRISLIKDINLARPHRAHVEILADLSLAALAGRKAPSDFRALYDLWLETLSAAELNKRFYEELADWFAWASTSAPLAFSKGQGNGAGAKEIALIRLLTRLMFVWFIKEKGLVPEALFDGPSLAKLLKEPPAATPSGHGYYLSILQNLFFATLNTEMPERRWRQDDAGQSRDYLGHHVYRHATLFAEPEKALEAFASVPFLNGGLFECLDTEVASDDPRAGDAERERQRLILRIDGFSDQPDKQPRLPNALFFGGAKGVDLSGWFEKAKAPRDVPGLIDLFERYKFTVEENTPLEEEAALDPELLGKVFENLLASYNEDTKTTARNKSGSFYTPREVVDFMVDEALVAWLLPKLPSELGLESDGGDETRLRALLSFASRSHDFSPAQVDALIAAIESCKAIDPAVGSGAFPLGLLQKLVHMLDVLDPGGEKWKARNRLYYERRLAEAEAIPAASERAAEIEKAQEALGEFDAKFESGHYPDYTRKLFLIDRCLHGVDIQPIAVQIAKLRCFISLAVEQKENPGRPNRGITPLPNLEAKFVAANTLTPLHRRGQAGLVSQDLLRKQRALREANRAFFAAANSAAKRREQRRIKLLRAEIADEVMRDHAFAGDDARKLAAWGPFDPNAFAPFFDAEWMFGFDPSATSGWFDIALANPPYIRSGKIDPVFKVALKRDYPGFFAGSSDILTYFFKITESLLVKGGVLSFITSNNYMRAGYGAATRELLSKQFQPLVIVDFGELPVFKAAVDSTVYIGIDGAGADKPFRALTIKTIDDISRLGEIVRESPPSIRPSELDPSGWSFAPPELRALADRMDRVPTKVSNIVADRFYYGIKTGFNAAFLIDDAFRQRLRADGADQALIRPWIDGGEIGRWEHGYSDQYLIAIASGSNIKGGWPWSRRGESDAERVFAREHPALFRHLSQWRTELKKRSDKGEYWWELRACAYWDAFKQTKIAYNETSAELHAFVDEDGFCFNKTAFILLPEDPWSLLAILLSKPLDFYYRMRFPSHGDPFNGGRPQFRKDRMLTVPVPVTTAQQRSGLALLAQAVTRCHEAELLAVAARLEALINALVYELFFADELHARNLLPFVAARDAGLMNLVALEGPALARAAEDWSRCLADPAHPLYATLFDLQSIDAVRIIEGRA
ncbi:Eco57I restriction-modification methylase domain-containing protein [Rhodopila globiformis]|uniref:site-specific DNA-methyltransferase (adenine-specific) n=1 Tax=Rhodopila globiformis TaxID=1071 RepID=A0A2S6NFC6_RHOGL|nr:TaqI-like C-terminal specificity domain-containing protein [Rhodopila globiformis]PPQ33342.1 hypothetical protein CCS01_14495 [Rhodopila globiformis]